MIRKVLCAGDSVTQGVHLASPNESYPAILGRLLGNEYTVMNGGMTGSTMLKKGDAPYWNLDLFRSGSGYNPDIVVLMLGTNDAKPVNWAHKAEFAADVIALVDHYRMLPSHPKVLLGLPCPVFAPMPTKGTLLKEGQFIDPRILQTEIIPILRKVATQLGIPTIDVNRLMASRSADFPDGIHPNAKGNEDIAGMVYGEIRRQK